MNNKIKRLDMHQADYQFSYLCFQETFISFRKEFNKKINVFIIMRLFGI